MKKAEMDEFGWILIGALVFILIVTVVWLPSEEPTPVVDPSSVELNIVAGSATSFFITINGSKAGKMTNVTLTALDPICNWISFDRNKLEIEESEKVRVNVIIPKGTTPGTYIGKIKVSSPGGETSVSLKINVVSITEAKIKSRPIFLGDVNVKYSVGSESLATWKDLEIARSYFTDSDLAVNISIPVQKLQITTDGYINLTIEEAKNVENLIIVFNGYTLLNIKVGTGTLIVPIDSSMIANKNSLVVYTVSPPWYNFWSKSAYKIKEMNFFVNYQDIMERERLFDLNDEEIVNFKYFRLTGRVDDYSTPLEEMEIKINNQLVYSNRPPLAFLNETFEKDILGNMLYFRNKDNVISFSFEKNAYYNLEDAFLIVYYR